MSKRAVYSHFPFKLGFFLLVDQAISVSELHHLTVVTYK